MSQSNRFWISASRTVGLAMMVAMPTFAACELAADIDSQTACAQYCSKSAACAEADPTDSETSDCIAECRSDIENNCGNDQQAEANTQIMECVDLSCTEFATCMVFEAAPACFGFAND